MAFLFAALFTVVPTAQAEAPAPGVIVWMEPTLPGADVAAKASRLTDGASPYAWGDFAFARTEETEADRARLLAVTTAVETGRKRWLEFDVEKGIAQQINTAVDTVEILRDDFDRNTVVEALLMSGLATQSAFPESRFGLVEEAAPFRAMIAARAVQRAWVDALALEPDATWTRKEVDSATGLAAILALQNDLRSLPRAVVTLPERPKGVTLYVDGRPTAEDATQVELFPGKHYLHAMVGGRLAGRARVNLEPGQSTAFPLMVGAPALAEAHSKVLAGDPTLPESVMSAVAWYRTVGGRTSRLYLGALDENGKPHILPFAGGAELVRPKPVTVLLAGDIAGGFVLSEAFDGRDGERVTAPAFGPHLGLQLGIYNFLLMGGATAYVTPTERMVWAFAEGDGTDTLAPIYARPYVGAGVYLPRPTSRVPLLQIAGTYGWFLPGSSGFGAMLGCGIPVKADGTWIRISLDGSTGTQGPAWPAPGTATWTGLLRIGFERKL